MNLATIFGGKGSSEPRRPASATTDYIDLSDYAASEKTGDGGAATYIRVAELKALDDLKHFSSYLYDGNVLILDFRPVQGDEVLLRRLTNELRKMAQDTGGDIAGLGEHHIIVTPTGIKVDRRKVTPQKEEAPAAPPVATSFSPAAPSAAPAGRSFGRK